MRKKQPKARGELASLLSAGTFESSLAWQLEHLYKVGAVTEFRFSAARRFRFDVAIRAARVGVEIHGGLFARDRGKHSRGAGQLRDFEKLNLAALEGWAVMQYAPDAVKNGSAAAEVAQLVALRAGVEQPTAPKPAPYSPRPLTSPPRSTAPREASRWTAPAEPGPSTGRGAFAALGSIQRLRGGA